MTPNLYALLVGIDEYPENSSVPSLLGCKSDVKNMRAYLESQFIPSIRHIEELVDHHATYSNIYEHFERVAQNITSNDFFLFHYSGHGSREPSAKEFKPWYPEGVDETLVCYDSRTKGGYDLADKELAYLIHSVAQKCSNVIIILDCCHSGSGTRGTEEMMLGMPRQTSNRKELRPLGSYANGYYYKLLEETNKLKIPESKHLLLAACHKKEKAYETSNHEGLFTSTLIQTLRNNPNISYAQLYNRCCLSMESITSKQHPQFEGYGHFNNWAKFLQSEQSTIQKKYLASYKLGRWVSNCGLIHGLQNEVNNPAEFEIIADEKIIGYTQASQVRINDCVLVMPDWVDRHKTYTIRLISNSSLPIFIKLIIDQEGKKRLEQLSINKNHEGIYFRLDSDIKKTKYSISIKKDSINIQKNNLQNNRQKTLRIINGNDYKKMLADAFNFLEHIGEWEKTLQIDNNKTSLNRSEIVVEISGKDGLGNSFNYINEELIQLFTTKENTSKFKPVYFTLRLQNKSPQNLFVTLLYASPEYGLHPIETKELPSNSTVIFMTDSFKIIGKDLETTDIFKILVGTEVLSAFQLSMENIKVGESVNYYKDKIKTGRGVVRVNRTKNNIIRNDWYVKTMEVKTIGKDSRSLKRDKC